jgi:hypothetical protein
MMNASSSATLLPVSSKAPLWTTSDEDQHILHSAMAQQLGQSPSSLSTISPSISPQRRRLGDSDLNSAEQPPILEAYVYDEHGVGHPNPLFFQGGAIGFTASPAPFSVKPPPPNLHPEVLPPDCKIDPHKPVDPNKYHIKHSHPWVPAIWRP